MSKAETRIEGFIATPELRYTQSGKPVLTVSAKHARRKLNEATNQWEDDGEPLWVRGTFWEAEAEYLSTVLNKGDYVVMSGEPMLRMYDGQNGPGVSFELRKPSIAVVPRAPKVQQHGGYQGQQQGGQFGGQPMQGWGQPAQQQGGQQQNPWGGQGATQAPPAQPQATQQQQNPWGNQNAPQQQQQQGGGFGSGFDDEQPF